MSMRIVSNFIASSYYLPQKILNNHDLSKIVDTSNEWILQRTGILQRHIAAENENACDLAIKVAKNIIKNNDINFKDIDLIITSTTTHNQSFPSVSCIVQEAIDNQKALCLSIQEACSGFIYGVTIADKFLRSGSHKVALVIAAEKMSSIVDWQDRNTCVLFGDGAGAAIFKAENGTEKDGIIDSIGFADGRLGNILNTTVANNKVAMNGKEVFKYAVNYMTDLVNQILERNNLKIDDIKMIVPHQANARILTAVAKNLKCSDDKIANTVADHANTSSATIPMALTKMIELGKISKGDLVILESVGAGLTWGAILLRI